MQTALFVSGFQLDCAHDIIEQPPGHKQAQVPQVVFKVRELRAEGGSSVQPVNFVMLRS